MRDCYVLMFARSNPRTDAETKSSIAIYKKGKIIGLVDTVIESSTCMVKTIADINCDGEIEVVVAVVEGISAGQWETYWIFSWNGKRLRVINAVDREAHQSLITAPWDFMTYKDLDGDGIYELVTSFEDEKGIERQHIYSWNGKLYGEWGKSSKALLKKPLKKRK